MATAADDNAADGNSGKQLVKISSGQYTSTALFKFRLISALDIFAEARRRNKG
ncbi:hypothetical protein [Clostridium sp. KNHs205]|uniref:hypothetical protein n=1 Tax=Clostridium sp. KNHs205 TaxID=1449050 RepID=UPI0012DEE317|nr:hypothetical protein [Clostridium sp. KNHs205]